MFRYRKLTDKPVDADKIPKLDLKINLEELAAGIYKINYNQKVFKKNVHVRFPIVN